MVESLIGCVAGAVLVDETRAMAEAAGLAEIQLTPKPGYVDAMMDWNDPLYRKIIETSARRSEGGRLRHQSRSGGEAKAGVEQ